MKQTTYRFANDAVVASDERRYLTFRIDVEEELSHNVRA